MLIKQSVIQTEKYFPKSRYIVIRSQDGKALHAQEHSLRHFLHPAGLHGRETNIRLHGLHVGADTSQLLQHYLRHLRTVWSLPAEVRLLGLLRLVDLPLAGLQRVHHLLLSLGG